MKFEHRRRLHLHRLWNCQQTASLGCCFLDSFDQRPPVEDGQSFVCSSRLRGAWLTVVVCFFRFPFPASAFQRAPPVSPLPPTDRHPPFPSIAPPPDAAAEMSTPKLLAQALPSLSLASKRTGGSIARHVRCYTKPSAAPLPAAPSPSPFGLRPPSWSTAMQSRAFSASATASHGHVHAPKPGEEYGSPINTPLYRSAR